MSNKFFVNKEIYKARLEVCRGCDKYIKFTGNCKVCGCFMRIKASISVMECPEKKWIATRKVDTSIDIPEHLKQEVLDIAPDIQHGRAKDIQTKIKLIELYNTIYGENHKTSTNCSSCLNTIYKQITKLIDDLQ